MRILTIDHIALAVSDLAASDHFYATVLGLPRLERPAFDFPGAWFALGDRELHLIGKPHHRAEGSSRGNHFALAIDDVDQWLARIAEHAVPHKPIGTRPDGARQLFIEDPDGHWIELCQPVG
jgi:lactoylglutathione lyase